MPKREPNRFKRDVVSVTRLDHLTILEARLIFGVEEESLCCWMRHADIIGSIRAELTRVEQSELVRFRQDRRRLEMKNETLRRAAAYFAS